MTLPEEIVSEIRGRADARPDHWVSEMTAAADAYHHERYRDAHRHLRPLRDNVPDAPSVAELLGLTQYRIGNYRAAILELEAYREMTDEVDQIPVLMDSYRAQRRHKKVDELWEELAAASPSADIVTEGRIVAAGSLADRGDLGAALDLLRRKSDAVKRPKDHHLRLWYALADLEDRAGNHARARALFERVEQRSPGFADARARLKTLR